MMRRVLVLVAGLTLAVSACSAPVGVARVDPRTVKRNLTASAVSAARPSSFTRNVLHEQECFVLFQDQPEEALRRLHGVAVSPETGTWRELFALTEMPPGPFDSRGRIAADITSTIRRRVGSTPSERVVFIATPHRGSYLTLSRASRARTVW